MYNGFVGSVFFPEGVEVTDELVDSVKFAANKTFIAKEASGLLNLKQEFELEDGSVVEVFCGEHHSFAVFHPVRPTSEGAEEVIEEEEEEYVPAGLVVQISEEGVETVNSSDVYKTWLFGYDNILYENWPTRTALDAVPSIISSSSPETQLPELAHTTFCQAFGSGVLDSRELWGGGTNPYGNKPPYQAGDYAYVSWPIVDDNGKKWYVHAGYGSVYATPTASSSTVGQNVYWLDAWFYEDDINIIMDVSKDGKKFLAHSGWTFNTASNLGHVWPYIMEDFGEGYIVPTGDDPSQWSGGFNLLRARYNFNPSTDGGEVITDPEDPRVADCTSWYHTSEPKTGGGPKYFVAMPTLTWDLSYVTTNDPPNLVPCGETNWYWTLTVTWPVEDQLIGTAAELKAKWPTYFSDTSTAPEDEFVFPANIGRGGAGPFVVWGQVTQPELEFHVKQLRGAFYKEDNSIELVWFETYGETEQTNIAQPTVTGSLVINTHGLINWTPASESPTEQFCVGAYQYHRVESVTHTASVDIPAYACEMGIKNVTATLSHSNGTLNIPYVSTTNPTHVSPARSISLTIDNPAEPYYNWWTGLSFPWCELHWTEVDSSYDIANGEGYFTMADAAQATVKGGYNWNYDIFGSINNNQDPSRNYMYVHDVIRYILDKAGTVTLSNGTSPDSYSLGNAGSITIGDYNWGIRTNISVSYRRYLQNYHGSAVELRYLNFDRYFADSAYPFYAETHYSDIGMLHVYDELPEYGVSEMSTVTIANTCGGKVQQFIVTRTQDFVEDYYYPVKLDGNPCKSVYWVSDLLTPDGVVEVTQPTDNTLLLEDVRSRLAASGTFSTAVYPDVRTLSRGRPYSTYNPITAQAVTNLIYPAHWVGSFDEFNPKPKLEKDDPVNFSLLGKKVYDSETDLPVGPTKEVQIDANGDYVIIDLAP